MIKKSSRRKQWQLPWGKFLQQVPWSGNEGIVLEEEPLPILEEIDILQLPEPPVLHLPARPMLMPFGKLLQAIPWSGSNARIPQNRLKEVIS